MLCILILITDLQKQFKLRISQEKRYFLLSSTATLMGNFLQNTFFASSVNSYVSKCLFKKPEGRDRAVTTVQCFITISFANRKNFQNYLSVKVFLENISTILTSILMTPRK